MRGIRLSIPYTKKLSEEPSEESQLLVSIAIEKANRTPEPIDLDMLLVVVKSPERPNLKNVMANIFSTASKTKETQPKGVFADWNKSPDNVIIIKANNSYFI